MVDFPFIGFRIGGGLRGGDSGEVRDDDGLRVGGETKGCSEATEVE